jgi:uncharacterized protein
MKEIRSINDANFRVINEDDRYVEGYALIFNSFSQDFGGWVEIIEPTALEGVLERSDILAVLNHDDNYVLARCTNMDENSTLKLSIDERGLKYSFYCPETPTGIEVYEGIKRGDLRNSSFAFTIQEEYIDYSDNERWIRTIKKFDRLFDVSPVWSPAYLNTTIGKRSIDETKERLDKEYQKMLEERQLKLKEYYDTLRDTYLKK